MSINKTAYFITIGETDIDKPDIDGIIADEFEETLIFVGRLIERKACLPAYHYSSIF